MSRTLRRRNCRHKYWWVLRDPSVFFSRCETMLDPVSPAGRRALALYHSDNHQPGTLPQWWRRACKANVKTKHERMIRRWLNNPEFDPVFVPRHNKGWF